MICYQKMKMAENIVYGQIIITFLTVFIYENYYCLLPDSNLLEKKQSKISIRYENFLSLLLVINLVLI